MAVPHDKMAAPAYEGGPYGPPAYERTTTSNTVQESYEARPPISFQPEYLKTRDGILKLAQTILSLITFICACSWGFGGAGWVEFVSISAFFLSLILLIFILIQVIYRIPGPQLLVVFIYYAVFSVFYLISALVAIGFAAKYNYPAAGATAFFTVVVTPLYGVDTYFQFKAWRSGMSTWGPPTSSAAATTVTSTTTTTTTMESGRPAVY